MKILVGLVLGIGLFLSNILILGLMVFKQGVNSTPENS